MNKFTKLMMLTTSSNDHEALSALRKANSILQSQSVSWEQMIRGMKNVIIHSDPPPAQEKPKPKMDDPKIEEMLKIVLASIKGGSGKDFIDSLAKFYKEKGFLTPKQQAALEKFYGNCL